MKYTIGNGSSCFYIYSDGTHFLKTVGDSVEARISVQVACNMLNEFDRLKAIESAAKPVLDAIIGAANGERSVFSGTWAATLNNLSEALAAAPEQAHQNEQRPRDYVAMLEAVAECATLMLEIKMMSKHDLCTCSTCRLHNALDRLQAFKSKEATK